MSNSAAGQEEIFLPKAEESANSSGEIKIDGSDLKYLQPLPSIVLSNSNGAGSNIGESQVHSIARSEVLDYGDECFLLKNVFTLEECSHYIKEGEDVGFASLGRASNSYRSCKRISFQSPELSALLWKRISPHLHTIDIQGDPQDQHIEGIPSLMKGTWKPKGLNDVFRLCRYFPGDHFAPHHDGFFVKSMHERSLQTFMLYLNGDFLGGSTNFIDPTQQLYKGSDGKYCAEEKNILYRVNPETGMAIIFNHHRLHEGERLGNGTKYILRTDIMFENTKPNKVSENQEKAIQLLQEADRLESAGKCLESMELYRKAYKLFPDLDSANGVL